MRKGFSTAFTDRQQVVPFLEMVAEAGFDGIEPTLLPEGIPSRGRWEADAELLREEAAKVGLAVPSMRGGPLFWPRFASDNPADREEAVAIANTAMRCVKAMGGEVLLVVPGRWEPHLSYAQAAQNARETAARLGDIAAEAGVTVGLENVENHLFLSPTEWCDLIDTIGHPRIRMYYDVGNTIALRQGYPPQWIRQLGRDRIARVHFKDAVEGVRTTWLLEGEVDWPGVRRALADIGYDDWICAELPPYKHAPRRMLERTARDMDAIWALV